MRINRERRELNVAYERNLVPELRANPVYLGANRGWLSGIMSKAGPTIALTPSQAELDNPVLRFYFDYWHRKRGGNAMPSRADINPSELRPYLGSIILLEALPGLDDFRYRLIGTRVTDYFLGDATGTTIREAYALSEMNTPHVDSIISLHRTVCESKMIVRVKGPQGEWRGQLYPPFDALYLPLSDDGVIANMILTAFTFDSAQLRAARPEHSPVKPV